ncbi:hypothetical protein [Marinobacter salsuginis]|uniref:hypothetical protein n=1 Tax=Marinobacter salsuginis TaxID=418719 RepID=UPI00273F163C|nr:hypothetical protein [Marinobacter salsuginis]
MSKIDPDAFRKQLQSADMYFNEKLSDSVIEEMVTLHARGFTDDQIVEFIVLGMTEEDIPPPETH